MLPHDPMTRTFGEAADEMGDSPTSHEGTDDCNEVTKQLAQPVTHEELKAILWSLETRLRREQAMKRYAFERRVTEKFEKRMDDARQQIAEPINKS